MTKTEARTGWKELLELEEMPSPQLMVSALKLPPGAEKRDSVILIGCFRERIASAQLGAGRVLLIGWLMLGETPTGLQLTGLIIAVSGWPRADDLRGGGAVSRHNLPPKKSPIRGTGQGFRDALMAEQRTRKLMTMAATRLIFVSLAFF